MRTPALQGPLTDAKVWPVRNYDDLTAAKNFLSSEWDRLAIDTETTGLSYHDEVRLVQFGDTRNAWVYDPKEFPQLTFDLMNLMVLGYPVVMHNSPFDCLHLARLVDSPVEYFMTNVADTQIFAHLLDPRDKIDGGTGKGLKECSAHYVDSSAPDSQSALKVRFKELGYKMSEGFAKIDRWDPTLVLYAGIDVILTARLHQEFKKVLPREMNHLVDFDHEVQTLTTRMTQKGVLVDLDYTQELLDELDQELLDAQAEAYLMGVDNVSSTKQVAEALQVRGILLEERTPSGAFKVDKTILESLDDELARAVLTAKASMKATSSWIDPIFEHGRIDGRVHPRIKTLAARTSRMSITDPPLQQLPSGDHRVRSCLIADPGHSLVACDFSQVEFRVLAALANEEKMIQTFAQGGDLHSANAERLFGPGFTQEQRRLAKGVGFGKIYGGGVDTLSRQAGVSKSEARKTMAAFDRSFPRVTRWSRQLIDKVTHGEALVQLPTGRKIPIDRRFGYRATNYMIQGLAADLFKGALLELDKAGMADYLLIPVHDEIIAQYPTEQAEEFSKNLEEIMSGDLGPVPITAEAEVIGRSWGDKYKKEDLYV